MSAESTGKQGRSAAEIIQQINVKNAKLLALTLVIGFVIYHGMLHLRYGIDSCKWLLSDGRYKGDQEWQPYGCMMHHYSQTDTRRCLRYLAFWGKHNHFVFIGDSRIRQLYLAFLHHLDPQEDTSTTVPVDHHHSVLSFGDSKLRLKVQFIWSPFVSKHMVEDFQNWKEPVNTEKLHPARAMITNEQIDMYNKAAMELWSSSRLVAQGNLEESQDGLHLGPLALKHDTQLYEFLVLSVVLVMRGWIQKWRGLAYTSLNEPGKQQQSDFYVLVTSLARMGVIMAYFFLCDSCICLMLQVLFRLNFMTVTLCLCMNRPYQFYYFVPLVSFWFLMVYLVLALPPQVTAASSESNPLQYLYLVLKFVGLFSVITILYMSEVFFEKVFVTRPWKALFVTTDDDIHEWWFRWKLDRYSISYGMVFAVAYLLAQRYSFLDDNNHSNLFSPGIALSATLASLIGLGSYTTFSFLFFAWFGRISLELFISQYHIWLAADTHGVLVLVPGYPVLNVMVTSFIFVCVAHEVHAVTFLLMPYAVPPDWRLVLRNALLFLVVLVPIGIHDGMF
ncbi:hypothetical protein C0J52_06243 [Blattella germanica]|nr:hypothetical protein C0J52_06243 [Blattella germanica]